MANKLSIDKIITTYFAGVTKKDFTYKGKVIKAKPLCVSPTLFRGCDCFKECGGCCSSFSLDYLPKKYEPHPYQLEKRFISFNGESIPIFSDIQKENKQHHCRHVDMKTGYCLIHGTHPFSCDFELLRVSLFIDPTKPNRLGNQLYGRGWNMLKINGERGAICKITPITRESVKETIRKLNRLLVWCVYFGVDSWIPDILNDIPKGQIIARTRTYKP